jgi:uncharacterized RDD family membrane protein YckC
MKCSECRRDVSDRAAECPNCGNPIRAGGGSYNNIVPASVEQKELAIIRTLQNQDIQNPAIARNVLNMYNNGSYKFQSQAGLDFINNLNRIAGVNQIIHNPFDIPYSTANNYNLAKPAERLIAFLIDYLLTLPITIIGFGISIYWEVNYFDSYYSIYTRSIIEPDINYLGVFFWCFVMVIYCIIYFIIQIGYYKKGTSFGKSKRNLYVVNKETGQKLSFTQMFWLRECIGKLISGFILYLGYLWILFDKENQGWHDKLCSSVVITDNSQTENRIYF